MEIHKPSDSARFGYFCWWLLADHPHLHGPIDAARPKFDAGAGLSSWSFAANISVLIESVAGHQRDVCGYDGAGRCGRHAGAWFVLEKLDRWG